MIFGNQWTAKYIDARKACVRHAFIEGNAFDLDANRASALAIFDSDGKPQKLMRRGASRHFI
jgi:hypothetical protein